MAIINLDKLPFMAFQCLFEPPGFPFVFASEGCEILTQHSHDLFEKGTVKFSDIIHSQDLHIFNENMDATVAVGAPVELVFRILTKDNSCKRVFMRGYVAKTDDSGMPYIIEGFLTDITKQMQIDETSRSNRANSDFWSKTGFEVRTPMNAILGLAELGLREDLPASIREYTQIIKQSGITLMEILNNIMDYKQIESGEMQILEEEYSPASLIKDIVDRIKEQAGKLDFNVFVDSKLPSVLVGDPIRVRQIIQNLLSNSIKFTDTGYIALSVKGEVLNNSIKLIITVEDTGRGIKENDYTNLFEPFAQFDDKTIAGTGLGLPIVSNLLKLMGGSIDIASGFGVGCVFTVELPQQMPKNAPPLCEIVSPELKNILLLLPMKQINAGSMGQSFKNLGVKCKQVSTIEDFIEAMKAENFTHIFADAVFSAFIQKEFKTDFPLLYVKSKIILITNYKHAPSEGYTTAPLYCSNIAEILNGTQQAPSASRSANFTAPDARVLIVDDISANLTVVSGFLKPFKLQMDFCESGVQAVEAVKLKKYDFILMDHLMPVMTGVEATQHIRALPKGKNDFANIPIVAMTANTDPASRRLFKESGFSDFLPKPIDAEALISLVAKWVPEEKKHRVTGIIAAVSHDRASFSIKGVDVQKGIDKMGGQTSAYLNVLKKYYENGRELTAKLHDSVKNNDMENYYIYIHAVAGISEGIGASECASAARVLELAAQRGNEEFVRAHNAQFVESLQELLDNVAPIAEDFKAERKPAPPSPSPEKKKRVLIVDDTDVYLSLLDDILMPDYITLASLSGEAGLKTARRAIPDFILLDAVMPGMSGYDVLEELKKDDATKHIPVVIMSARNDETNKWNKLGAAGFVLKPFDPITIREMINQMLEGSKQ